MTSVGGTAGRPLADRRVVVTRAPHQADELCRALGVAGATVKRLPLLAVLPGDRDELQRAAEDLSAYAWLVFSSSNAVDALLPLVPSPGPAGLRLAVIGPATAAAARRLGWEPDLQAAKSDGEGLAQAMATQLSAASRILLPQADDARPHLAAGLRRTGATVDAIVAYRKGLPPAAEVEADHLFAGDDLGWVTFTSPRIVRHFVRLDIGTPEDWRRRLLAELRPLTVGPVTSAELRRHGLRPAAEARRPTPEGMVEAMIRALS